MKFHGIVHGPSPNKTGPPVAFNGSYALAIEPGATSMKVVKFADIGNPLAATTEMIANGAGVDSAT